MRFYLVDKIIEFKKGESIKGWKNVSMTEPFFTFHFPRHPVLPGVLIIEAMAQLAGLMIEIGYILSLEQGEASQRDNILIDIQYS